MSQEQLALEQKRKVCLVIKSYRKTFCYSFLIVFIGIILAALISEPLTLAPLINYLLNQKMSTYFEIGGIIFTATTLGVRGWDVQTWSGNSNAERLNQTLFIWLSIIGLLLFTIGILLQ